MPLLVKSGVFSFSFVSWGQIFGVFFAPFPEEEISDYIAHGPIIRVLTVAVLLAHIPHTRNGVTPAKQTAIVCHRSSETLVNFL